MSNLILVGSDTYTLYQQSALRAVYIGPLHTDLKKDMIIVTTQEPSRNTSNNGARRGSMTFIKTHVVPVNGDPACTVLQDSSIKVMTSLPVGSDLSVLAGGMSAVAAVAASDIVTIPLFARGQLIGLGA